MLNFRSLAFVALALALSSAVHCLAEEISNPKLGYAFTLPEGFLADDQLRREMHVDQLWERIADDPTRSVFISLKHFPSVLGREPSVLPPGARGMTSTLKWNDYDIQYARIIEESTGLEMVTYGVHVPLKPQAIAIDVSSTVANDAEAEKIMRALVASVRGPSNWADEDVAGFLPAGSPAVRFSIMASIVIGGLAILIVARRTAQRGMILALCFLIYFSTTLVSATSADALLLVGSFRLLAVAGGLLGLIDLCWPRPEPDPVAPEAMPRLETPPARGE
jgi:hypothetical protein